VINTVSCQSIPIPGAAAERMLNTAITQAKISESFEEYLEIFDKFYAE